MVIVVGPVPLGVVAACVVLFVPMGMAGYHLSRNKVLFFGGALFIALAVAVHLSPYFPSVSEIVHSLSSVPTSPSVSAPDDRSHCLPFLHHLVWIGDVNRSWTWSGSTAVIDCGLQKLRRSDACDLLNGSYVLVAGDSQARLFVLSFLDLVLEPEQMESVHGDLFKRHSDYSIVIEQHGLRLDFVWAPYASNLTSLMTGLVLGERRWPDVLVMGSGLWHMLHFTDASGFAASLNSLRRSVVSLPPLESEPARPMHMFWLGLPRLVNSLLNTEEKRQRMNGSIVGAYDQALIESGLLRRLGGPMLLLDVGVLSSSCGVECTEDGMHYSGPVYDAAVQIMLNALLIESRQRI
ncbi:hypothetical protein QJS10_CPB11g02221 [Acorus calamus]|uniref:Pmr5/Cas1p GDSL/SGNH-like acyl-esterase family protein n=1 Tax=Acorus calamus TaxID=4465 RepID=A0AAV9DQ57_ACOCL|nr:hypothetical protein QJS10_CPB11g02221 [Acorus calamus]